MLALVKYDNKWNILLTPLVKLIFSQPPTASSYHTKAHKLCEAEKPLFFFSVSFLICLSSCSFSLLLWHLLIDLFPVSVRQLILKKPQYIKSRICKNNSLAKWWSRLQRNIICVGFPNQRFCCIGCVLFLYFISPRAFYFCDLLRSYSGSFSVAALWSLISSLKWGFRKDWEACVLI